MRRNLIPLLKEGSEGTLRVDYLRIHHLYTLGRELEQVQLTNLHFLLFRGWVSKLEESLSNLLASKQPICLVASEGNRLIASVIIKPINRKGNTWSISFPTIYTTPNYNTLREVKLKLLKYSLNVKANNIINWIIKYPSDSIDELSLVRELGFQPQKMIRSWSTNKNNKYNYNSIDNNINFKWDKINAANSEDLLRIENSAESYQLRSIMGHKSSDILELSNKLTGILYFYNQGKAIAAAGLLKQNFPEDINTFKLIRDVIWDERLHFAIPKIIQDTINKKNRLIIECDSKDDYLNNLLESIGLDEINQKILLGKSNLKRTEKRYSLSQTISFENMLDNLNPPIPSP